MKNGVRAAIAFNQTATLSFVIPRAWDFNDLFEFSAHLNRVFFTRPKKRHPERSAAQPHPIMDGVWRGVEGPRRCLLADVFPSFPATKYSRGICGSADSSWKCFRVPSAATSVHLPLHRPFGVQSWTMVVGGPDES
jgi:hypothetical protein